MTRSTLVFAIAIPVFVSVQASAAQHGHAGAPTPNTHAAAGPKTTTQHGSAAAGPKTTAAGPKTTKTTTVAHGSHATKSHATKTTTHGNSHASAKAATAGTKAPKTTKSSKAATTTTTSSGGKKTTTVTTAGTLTPTQQKLQRNSNLASKLQSRLPAGTDLMAASAGFRNLGQFVAAVNVSNNLGIPFSELKTRMVTDGMSLGQAIQDTRPSTTDTTTIARRAETDADAIIRSTESPTTSSTKTKTKSKAKKNGSH